MKESAPKLTPENKDDRPVSSKRSFLKAFGLAAMGGVAGVALGETSQAVAERICSTPETEEAVDKDLAFLKPHLEIITPAIKSGNKECINLIEGLIGMFRSQLKLESNYIDEALKKISDDKQKRLEARGGEQTKEDIDSIELELIFLMDVHFRSQHVKILQKKISIFEDLLRHAPSDPIISESGTAEA